MVNKAQTKQIDVHKFKDRLKTLLEDREKTQKEVATAINRDPRSFGHYVSGQTIPDIEVLFRLARHFKTSSDYLIGLSSDSGKNDFIETPRTEYNVEQKVYDLYKNYRYSSVFTFENRHSSTRRGDIIGLKISWRGYEPVFPLDSVLSVDTGYKSVKEDGTYVFEEDGIYKIRRCSPIDFSDKIKVCKVTDDMANCIEVAKTQSTIGKVISVKQAV